MQEINNDREQPNELNASIADAKTSELNNEFNKIKKENAEMPNGSLGKFKNTESLLSAYNNLQAEFTRKCQKLKEFEKFDDVKCFNSDVLSGILPENLKAEKLQGEFEKSISDKTAEMLQDETQCETNEPQSETTKNSQSETKENTLAEQYEQVEISQQVNQLEEPKKDLNDMQKTEQTEQTEQTKQNETQIRQMNEHSKGNSNQKIQFQQELLKDDEFIKNFIKSHSDIKEEILKSYLEEVQKTKSPKVISSSVGCGIPLATPPKPTNLEEAKEIIKKMFD